MKRIPRGLVVSLVVVAVLAPALPATAQPVVIEHLEYVKGDLEAIRLRQIEAFNEKYGDQIVISFQPIDWAGFLDKFPVMIAAGVMPDIVLVPDELWYLVSSQIALDLMPYVEADGWDLNELVPGTVKPAMEGDKLLALSIESWVPLVAMAAYNITMFREAGIAPPGPEWTWEEFLAYDKRMTRDVNGDGTVEFLGTDLGRHLVGSWAIAYQAALHAYGGSVIASDLSRATINSDVARLVFPMLKETADNFRTHVHDVGWEWAPLRTRQAAMSLGYASDILAAVTVLPGEIATQVMPQGPAGYPYFRNPNPPTPGWAFIIWNQSPHKDEAWQWLRFLTFEPEAITALKPLNLATPPKIPYRPNLDLAHEVLSDDFLTYVYPTLELASAVTQEKVVDPFGALQGPILEAIRDLVNGYFMERITLSEFLEDAERRINTVLAENPDLVAAQRAALGL